MKKYLLLGFAFLLLTSFVSALNTNDNVLYYSYDNSDLTGSNPNDLSGNGYDGSNVGTATTGQTGILKQSFYFDGSNDYIDSSDVLTDIADDTTGTVCSWINFDDCSNDQCSIWFVGDSGSNTYASFIIETNGVLSANFKIGNVWQWGLDTDSALNPDTDYYVCLVQDGTEPELYVNNNKPSQAFFLSADKTVWYSDMIGLDFAGFGARDFSGTSGKGDFFNGTIDESGYWDSNLDTAELSNLWNSGDGYNPYQSDLFELNTYDIYTGVGIDSFSANLTNGINYNFVSTTNGSIYWNNTNELINITTSGNTNYFNRSVYNINTSTDLNLSLYRHELYYPYNGYILNDSEYIDFQYNISNNTDLTNCSLFINETYENQSISIVNGLNTLRHDFNMNGTYEWFVECNGIESETRWFTAVNVSRPDIISYSPNLDIILDEGSDNDFEVTVSSPISYVIQWFKNGVSQAFGSLWNWIIGGDEQGDNQNITVIVTDSFNQTDSLTWNVNVTDVNLAPVVSAITVSEPTIFANINYYMSCFITDSDTDSVDIITDMQWSKDNSNWNDLTETYISGSEFRANIANSTHSEGDTISYRCRGTDNNTPALTSEWYYATDYRTIGVAQTAPETPNLLKPDYGVRKYNIPIVCAGSYDGQSTQQRISYQLEVRKNSTVWESIRNQSELIAYSYNINDDGYDTTYDFRCRAYDGIDYSPYITNINATIKKDIPVFSIISTMDTPVYMDGKQYSQGYFIDVSALGSDYSIYKVTGECNNDGVLDYVDDTGYKQISKGVFNCINQNGLIKHTIDAYIFKNNTNEKWSQICTGLDMTSQYCKISKPYEVTING